VLALHASTGTTADTAAWNATGATAGPVTATADIRPAGAYSDPEPGATSAAADQRPAGRCYGWCGRQRQM
jgi:hypothetical protein